jgi:hypothetical protein
VPTLTAGDKRPNCLVIDEIDGALGGAEVGLVALFTALFCSQDIN